MKRFTLHLDEDIIETFRDNSKKTGVPVAETIRRILRPEVEKLKINK